MHFEWLEQIACSFLLEAVTSDFVRRIWVVVLNMPSGVYSQVSPKVFTLGKKSFGRWRWEVLLNEDEMERVKRRWFWNGLKKNAWPILEFVTLRSKFVTLIFRTLGGEKTQNTFFGYKKWSKVESDDIFRSATKSCYIFDFYFFFNMSASYL